jgi:phosphomannomutase/phosphoglucomutase
MAGVLNPGIFREYDIRGVVGEDLDEERLALLGKSFGSFLRSKGIDRIVVGRDNRKSSPGYLASLALGLRSTGVSVVDVGEITTPCLLFAANFVGARAGLAVTASHNPPKYNGLKFVMDGRDVGGETIKGIYEIAVGGKFDVGQGGYERQDIFEHYINALAKEFRLKRTFTVAADAGNGTAGRFVLAYLEKLGCKVIAVNCESDPTFPNHPPDTVKPEYYGQLIEAVKEGNADCGLMFDGDGDRIAAVDERGEIVWADMLLLLYARDALSREKGRKIVVEIKCSQGVLDDIRNHGGVPILWKTGRTNIEDRMFSEGAVLGGEMSGHMFFNAGAVWLSESLYAAGKLLEILDRAEQPLSRLLTDVPKYHTSQEYRVPFNGKEEGKFALMEKILADFKEEWGDKVLDIDGARVVFPNGWALVRVSKGEPVFSMRFEGKTSEDLKEIMDVFREKLKKYPEMPVPF